MPSSLPLFLIAVAIGTYIQTVTGFALGIFVLASVALLHLASIPLTATALNIMNLGLASIVVIPGLRKVDGRIIVLSLFGMLPAMVVGVVLLDYLNTNAQHVLKMLLGGLIMAGGLVLACRPDPLEERSAPPAFVAAGALGGLFGGLFSVAGPPMVYLLYRQPIAIQTIRMTLLALFSMTSLGRLVVVTAHGDMTLRILEVGLMSLPVVAVAAWFGKRFPPPVSERNLRRGIFVLLMLTGGSILTMGLLSG